MNRGISGAGAVVVFFQPLRNVQRNSRIYRIVLAPEHVKEPFAVHDFPFYKIGIGGEGGIRTHVTINVNRFSRAAPSATRSPLHKDKSIRCLTPLLYLPAVVSSKKICKVMGCFTTWCLTSNHIGEMMYSLS